MLNIIDIDRISILQFIIIIMVYQFFAGTSRAYKEGKIRHVLNKSTKFSNEIQQIIQNEALKSCKGSLDEYLYDYMVKVFN